MLDQAGFARTGREVALNTPLDGRTGAVAEGRRRRAGVGPHVHRPRRRALTPDEARAAGRSARGSVLYHCGPVVVKEGESWQRHRRRSDDQHPRGAVPGRDHPALRRARRHRQGRHGREDARRAEGARRRVPQRDRRRGAVLRAHDHRGRRRLAARVRNARSDVAPARRRIFRRSSRWTRTATACTRTSSRSRASTWRRSALSCLSRSALRLGAGVLETLSEVLRAAAGSPCSIAIMSSSIVSRSAIGEERKGRELRRRRPSSR